MGKEIFFLPNVAQIVVMNMDVGIVEVGDATLEKPGIKPSIKKSKKNTEPMFFLVASLAIVMSIGSTRDLPLIGLLCIFSFISMPRKSKIVNHTSLMILNGFPTDNGQNLFTRNCLISSKNLGTKSIPKVHSSHNIQ